MNTFVCLFSGMKLFDKPQVTQIQSKICSSQLKPNFSLYRISSLISYFRNKFYKVYFSDGSKLHVTLSEKSTNANAKHSDIIYHLNVQHFPPTKRR